MLPGPPVPACLLGVRPPRARVWTDACAGDGAFAE